MDRYFKKLACLKNGKFLQVKIVSSPEMWFTVLYWQCHEILQKNVTFPSLLFCFYTGAKTKTKSLINFVHKTHSSSPTVMPDNMVLIAFASRQAVLLYKCLI